MPTGSDFTLDSHETNPSAVDVTLQLSSTADAGNTVDFTIAFDGGPPAPHTGTGTLRTPIASRLKPRFSLLCGIVSHTISEHIGKVGQTEKLVLQHRARYS